MSTSPRAGRGLPARQGLLGGAGVLLLAAGGLANEWLLASFSADGDLQPLTVVRIRVAQMMLAATGGALLGTRRWLSRPGLMRQALRDRPRLAAVAIGSCFAAVLLVVAEGVFGLLNRREGMPAYHIEVTTSDGTPSTDAVAVADDRLGYRLTPNRRARIHVTHRGRTIYDMVSVTDEFGRRITPIDGSWPRPEYLLFFGGSYTWGQGVAADDTLPAAVGRFAPRFQPYNYGYRGYGPQQMLELLRAADLRTQVPQSDGIAVYTAIDDHIRRTIGGMRTVTGARRGFPYFRLDDTGALVHEGSFEQGRPWLQFAYELLSFSQVLQYYNIDLPVRITDGHLALMTAIIEESRRSYRETFRNDRFFVVLYPGSRVLARLRPLFDDRGIRYLDYTNLFAGESRPLAIEGDGHPTPLAYRLVAERLATDLGIANESPGRSERR